jgi:DNA-binding phage protein
MPTADQILAYLKGRKSYIGAAGLALTALYLSLSGQIGPALTALSSAAGLLGVRLSVAATTPTKAD